MVPEFSGSCSQCFFHSYKFHLTQFCFASENKFEVIVVKKIGQVWEDPGRTLQQSNGAVAKFLKDTETNFPEYPAE